MNACYVHLILVAINACSQPRLAGCHFDTRLPPRKGVLPFWQLRATRVGIWKGAPLTQPLTGRYKEDLIPVPED